MNQSSPQVTRWLKSPLLVACSLFVWLGAENTEAAPRPEPTNWFSGDMHVHRNCGPGNPTNSLATISNAMVAADISVISLLADMGNAEVADATTDLPKVNGSNAPESPPGRIIRWDAEWHWDAVFYQPAPHYALGGHIVALGLTNAVQIWNESLYPIFEWARNQGGVAGLAHFQYLPDNSFPTTLDCCLPIEYPVEMALGTCDFISQDVAGANSAMLAYYRLLNCGFRPGMAAGSDFPCEAQIGALTTFVQVDGPLTYEKWITGIRDGRTVISRNGRREFLNLKVNSTNIPGSEIHFPAGGGTVDVSAIWSANTDYSGTIELLKNGVVITNKSASVSSNTTSTLTANVTFTNSGWLAVRRMSGGQHRSHTAAVYVTVDNQPVRASVADALFYVDWMNQLLSRTQPGGAWENYFSGTNKLVARTRYEAARAVYQQIANEAAAALAPVITTTNLPVGAVNSPYAQNLAAWRGQTPYTWSLASGALPADLTLNTNTGTIAGVPGVVGTNNFSVQLTDNATPPNLVTQSLSLAVLSAFPSMTLWPTSAVPAVLSDSDTNASTLGLKFKTLTRGQAKGIRFHKGMANTGTHTGQLWNSNGTLLASVTFSNETSTGWQQALFSTPVTLSSNTTYIASYYAPNGRYSKTENYFSVNGVTNPPLIALPSTLTDYNGVYRYGTNGLPTNTYLSTHYWVDVVFQPNNAPVLPVQTNRTVAELSLLTVTNTATDADVPANALTYQLLGAPTNASISANGIITWTPTEAQGPGTNTLMTVVSDGVATVTNQFQVIVAEANQAPDFAFSSTNLTVPELSLLVVSNLATDTDVPAQSIAYTLLSPPTNAVITNGIITWLPAEEQGPATNVLATAASDGVGATTNYITVVVEEVNVAPIFASTPTNTAIPDYGSLLIANGATDDDLPANTLTYELLSAPTNAVISTNGVITWTPSPEQAPSTNLFETVVGDGTDTVTNSFLVTVLAPLVAPTILSISLEDTNAIVTWTSQAGQSYVLEYLDELIPTNWTPVLPGATATGTNTSATNETGGAPMRIYRVRSPE